MTSSGLRRECPRDSAVVPACHLLDLPAGRLGVPCGWGVSGDPAGGRGGVLWVLRACWSLPRGGSGGRVGGRDDPKAQALEASRTLNPRPERVADPAFGPGGFFDPADLVQVKYEMVRKAEAGEGPAGRGGGGGVFSSIGRIWCRSSTRGGAGPRRRTCRRAGQPPASGFPASRCTRPGRRCASDGGPERF